MPIQPSAAPDDEVNGSSSSAIHRGERVREAGHAADLVKPHGGDDDQREEHERTLHDVRPGNREKSAEEGVGNDRPAAEQHGPDVGYAEQRLEQLACGDETGTRVEGEKEQHEGAGNQAQHPGVVVEAPLEIVRQGEGVVQFLGGLAQSLRHQFPVQVGADEQARDHPARFEPGEIGETRQAHQQPAAHVRRLGAPAQSPSC